MAVCRACGSDDLRDLGVCAGFPLSIGQALGYGADELPAGRLLRCSNCCLGQRHPCLQGDALVEAYRRTPSDSMDYRFEDNSAWVVARDVLTGLAGRESSLRVLDVGCHTGSFLAGLPVAWRRFGVESAEQPIRVASGEHNVQIVGERIEAIPPIWEGQFDAVTMFDVVEHLLNPSVGIECAAKLLRPGGVLIISTADMDAWTWDWAGGRHWYLQSPLHLSIASRSYFERAASDLRLKLRRFERIAHRRDGLFVRMRETIDSIHWECRERGGWFRVPQRFLQALPGFGQLRHRQSVPWSMGLKDHLVVMMERGAPA